jgi:hypothetical protein
MVDTYSHVDEVLLVSLGVDPRVDHVLHLGLKSGHFLLGELDGLVAILLVWCAVLLTVLPQLGLTPFILPISKAGGVGELGLMVGGVVTANSRGSSSVGLRGFSYSKRFHLFPTQPC